MTPPPSIVERLRALLAGATPGPWEARKSIHGSEYRYVEIDSTEDYTTLELKPQDADLIVALRNEAPTLLSRVEALEAALLRAKSVLIIAAHGSRQRDSFKDAQWLSDEAEAARRVMDNQIEKG